MFRKSIVKTIFDCYIGILFVFDTISLLIYILLLFFIIKYYIKNNPSIGREFLILFVYNGILDIIFLIEEYVTFRPAQLGVFRRFYIDIFSKYKISGISCTYSLCYVIVMPIAGLTVTFNRYFAITFPLKYQYFWSGWRLVILTVYPVFLVSPLFFYYFQSKVVYVQDEIGRLTFIYVDYITSKNLWDISTYTHCAVVIIYIILNILILKKCQIESKKTLNKKSKLNISVAKIGITYFVCCASVTAMEIISITAASFKIFSLSNDIVSIYPFIETLFVFTPLYSLLYLDKDIRSQFLLFIKMKNF